MAEKASANIVDDNFVKAHLEQQYKKGLIQEQKKRV